MNPSAVRAVLIPPRMADSVQQLGKLISTYAGAAEDAQESSAFEFPPVDGHRNDTLLFWMNHYVMRTAYTVKSPPFALQHPDQL
jgi:hypothetical protein